MAERDYEAAPVSDELALDSVIRGLAADLEDLRSKKISIQDALARAALAKQLFNGARLYLQAMRSLNTQPFKSITKTDDSADHG